MPPMTGYRFADVVLVPFPFTDQSATKKRPAVVVSSELFHRDHANVIVLAISSQHRPASETEAAVHHWQRAGLLNPSVIKPVITTLDTGLVIKKLGHLADDDRAALERILTTALGSGQKAVPGAEER